MSKIVEVDVFYDLSHADHTVYFVRDHGREPKERLITSFGLWWLAGAIKQFAGITTPYFNGWNWKRER